MGDNSCAVSLTVLRCRYCCYRHFRRQDAGGELHLLEWEPARSLIGPQPVTLFARRPSSPAHRCVRLCVCLYLLAGWFTHAGHAEGLRPDHQPDPGREPRAGVQLQPGGGAGGAGTLHCPRRQRVSDL